MTILKSKLRKELILFHSLLHTSETNNILAPTCTTEKRVKAKIKPPRVTHDISEAIMLRD